MESSSSQQLCHKNVAYEKCHLFTSNQAQKVMCTFNFTATRSHMAYCYNYYIVT